MSEIPTLYRMRYIPYEKVCLKDDIIVYMDDDVIVTKWKTIKPRNDFDNGISAFFLKRGFKISKFFKGSTCIYHYCDIIETHYDKDTNSYIFNDLLIDIVINPAGFVKVLDIAEIADALDKELITVGQAKTALRLSEELLNIIYSGNFNQLVKHLDLAD